MNIISRVNPSNLLQEKAKFWQDQSYNPQFEYALPFASDALTVWGKPKTEIYEHSLAMLEKSPHTGQEEKKESITEKEIQLAIDQFNDRYGFEEKVTVEFSPDLVAKCKVVDLTVHFLTPIQYSKYRFRDLIRHEFETHLLRRINHRRQGWKPHLVSEADVRKTEEGLAGLHTHLHRDNKLFTRSYLTYVAVYVAQTGSFADVFAAMKNLSVSNQTAWRIAVRTKRGLRDTSQPGGLTKDLTYLEGAIEVWDWLRNDEHQPEDLYLGRLGLAQIKKYKEQAKVKPYLPSFFDDLELYRQQIQEIGDVNEFSKLTS